ncbi:hypothetical protein [Heyndrickxia oleronia]|uniref:hypothetical protein n=1 Tax=Heyndrickxia oleronia TaxID=38875 RepID=UPI001C0F385F|nr:hypothetical protein [Heyndrickxia oleronia]MBU5214575.1 hypothetical protein [Heyndrickxia oleronia]MBU5214989.1 hypothetical protein [Heyndrickxia oleronia]
MNDLGLRKEEIIEMLKEHEGVSSSLLEKIADVIVANNKKIERNVTSFVSKELNKKISRTSYR